MARHPVEMPQLIRRQPQEIEDIWVDALQGPGRHPPQQVVERGAPAQRAGDDLGDEGPVARIGERRADSSLGMGQVDPFAVDALQDP